MKKGRQPGYKMSEEAKKKIAESRIGTKHSEETKQKISESIIEWRKLQKYEKLLKKEKGVCHDKNKQRR